MTPTELTRLAIQIADEDCWSVIQSYGVPVVDKLQRLLWWECDPNDPQDGWLVSRALRYLGARGQLRRNPKNANQVKLVRR